MATQITMDAPTVISFTGEEMSQERDALLLECGTYPDKGLTVTEEDLDGIVARFSGDGAPIKVEHMDTALDPLGRVQKVWRDGSVLMAKLLFPEDLAGFLRRRGVQKLSVGLAREKVGLALAEVSLVLKPRVAAAAMFGEEPNPPPPRDAGTPPETGGKGVETMTEAKDREIARLSAALTAREVEGQIASLKAAGRVVPATEHLARALLSVPQTALTTLTDSAAPLPVSQVFLSYLEAQPPVVEFKEMAGMGGASDGGSRSHHHAQGDLPTLTAEEEDFLKKLGLDPATVKHMMRHGTLPKHDKKGN